MEALASSSIFLEKTLMCIKEHKRKFHAGKNTAESDGKYMEEESKAVVLPSSVMPGIKI